MKAALPSLLMLAGAFLLGALTLYVVLDLSLSRGPSASGRPESRIASFFSKSLIR